MNGFLPFFVQPRLVPIIADEKTLLNPGKLLKNYQFLSIQKSPTWDVPPLSLSFLREKNGDLMVNASPGSRAARCTGATPLRVFRFQSPRAW